AADRQNFLSHGYDTRRGNGAGAADCAVPDTHAWRADRVQVASGVHRVFNLPAAGAIGMSAALNVWIVDDDESIRWVLERSLTRDGMQVQAFPGAAELLDALSDDTPDVLISDIRMPGVNGLELMERVRT